MFVVPFTRVLKGTCDGRVLSRTTDGVIVWTLNNTAAYIVGLSYSAGPSTFASKLDRALRYLFLFHFLQSSRGQCLRCSLDCSPESKALRALSSIMSPKNKTLRYKRKSIRNPRHHLRARSQSLCSCEPLRRPLTPTPILLDRPPQGTSSEARYTARCRLCRTLCLNLPYTPIQNPSAVQNSNLRSSTA